MAMNYLSDFLEDKNGEISLLKLTGLIFCFWILAPILSNFDNIFIALLGWIVGFVFWFLLGVVFVTLIERHNKKIISDYLRKRGKSRELG